MVSDAQQHHDRKALVPIVSQVLSSFSARYVDKILAGLKTQTRRTHKHEWKIGHVYPLRDNWYAPPKGYILITRKFRERLGNISPLDIRKEGCESLEEYKQIWEEAQKRPWNPDEIVIVYEFKVTRRT